MRKEKAAGTSRENFWQYTQQTPPGIGTIKCQSQSVSKIFFGRDGWVVTSEVARITADDLSI